MSPGTGAAQSSGVTCYESTWNNSDCCRRRIFCRSAILLRSILGRGVVDAAPNRSFVWVALRHSVRIQKRPRRGGELTLFHFHAERRLGTASSEAAQTARDTRLLRRDCATIDGVS